MTAFLVLHARFEGKPRDRVSRWSSVDSEGVTRFSSRGRSTAFDTDVAPSNVSQLITSKK
jgi:hypothetical protein